MPIARTTDSDKARLDDAARAGWLYFIAGHTQDEIAKRLNVSRATAQRLVSLCLTERLITFRLEHPITACMELAARMTDIFGLRYCEVVPTDPASPTAVAGIAEQVPAMDCPDHQLVSLVGNISPDGSASFFDTVARLADLTKARHYPMPLPVLMSSEREREQVLKMGPITKVRAIAAKADLRLLGVGQMDKNAQFHVDGFINRDELLELMRLGAVGELTGWAYDAEGRFIKGGTNKRLTSVPHPAPAAALTVAAA